jgi:cytochrome c551
MKMSRLIIAACFLFFALAIVSAQTTPSGATLTSNPVFEKSCAKCHGKTAEGRRFGGPSLISEKVAATSAGELQNIIAQGKGHMPKYGGKLTTEEIDALVQQIRASKSKP